MSRCSRSRAPTSLFYADGVHATGVDALSACAGVSKRTLYREFGSKDALAAEYLRRFGEPGENPPRTFSLTPDDPAASGSSARSTSSPRTSSASDGGAARRRPPRSSSPTPSIRLASRAPSTSDGSVNARVWRWPTPVSSIRSSSHSRWRSCGTLSCTRCCCGRPTRSSMPARSSTGWCLHNGGELWERWRSRPSRSASRRSGSCGGVRRSTRVPIARCCGPASCCWPLRATATPRSRVGCNAPTRRQVGGDDDSRRRAWRDWMSDRGPSAQPVMRTEWRWAASRSSRMTAT